MNGYELNTMKLKEKLFQAKPNGYLCMSMIANSLFFDRLFLLLSLFRFVFWVVVGGYRRVFLRFLALFGFLFLFSVFLFFLLFLRGLLHLVLAAGLVFGGGRGWIVIFWVGFLLCLFLLLLLFPFSG